MGIVVRFPRRHVGAPASSVGRKKASIGTAPPVASLSRLAKFIETPRSPLRISDRCDSEQPDSEASFAWLISPWLSSQAASGCFVSMTATLLLAKFICQALLCWQEMDIHSLSGDTLPMAKLAPKPAQDAVQRLYVGPWIRAHRFKPAEVSRATGINEGYLSGIISGKKKNPSTEKLALIADFLKMPLGDLYKPPPPDRLLQQLDGYDPETVIRLSQKRRKSS